MMRKEVEEIVREHISPELLPMRMLNAWLITPGFCEKVLDCKENGKPLDGVHILRMMQRCIEEQSEFLPKEQIAILRRSYRWLKQNYKQLRGFDEVHNLIRKETHMINREVELWRMVPEFEKTVQDLNSNGIAFTDDKLLSTMNKILISNSVPDGVDIKDLKKAKASLEDRIRRMSKVEEGS